MDKSLVFGSNAVDGHVDYVFDFSAQKGYVNALTSDRAIAVFDLNPENIAKAAFTGEWVESDNEDEIDENAQITTVSDMWLEALNSADDDEMDMTGIKAHLGIIALLLGVVVIPPFAYNGVQKILKEVKTGKTSEIDGYQAIVDGMGKDIVSA